MQDIGAEKNGVVFERLTCQHLRTMTAVVHPRKCPEVIRKVREQPKGDPQHIPYGPFLNATHSVLRVGPTSEPDDEIIPVKVYDGTSNTKIPFDMKKSDTIGKLKAAYVMKKPHMVGCLNLVYNGKPVVSEETLGALGVKAHAMFITYQKCVGG